MAIVAFSGEVTIYGDCSREPKVLAGDRLKDYSYLVTAATEYFVDRPVRRCACAWLVCVCFAVVGRLFARRVSVNPDAPV